MRYFAEIHFDNFNTVKDAMRYLNNESVELKKIDENNYLLYIKDIDFIDETIDILKNKGFIVEEDKQNINSNDENDVEKFDIEKDYDLILSMYKNSKGINHESKK